MSATLENAGGRPALRFERHLMHPMGEAASLRSGRDVHERHASPRGAGPRHRAQGLCRALPGL